MLKGLKYYIVFNPLTTLLLRRNVDRASFSRLKDSHHIKVCAVELYVKPT